MNTTIKNIFFRILLLTILSLACMGAKAYDYMIYFNDAADWGSVYVSVFSQEAQEPWGVEKYYVQEQLLTDIDNSTGNYMYTFSTDDDLSSMSNIFVQFHSGNSDYSSWEAFVNNNVYTNGSDTGGDEPPTSGDGTYTIYFNTSIGGGWYIADGSDGYNVYVDVYYTDPKTGVTTHYTTSNDNYATLSWTDTQYVLSWTYPYDEEIPEGAVCMFKDDWGMVTSVEVDFVNGHTYSANGTHYLAGTLFYDKFYGAWGHAGLDVSDVKIEHKQPKWCSMSDVSHDTFNKNGWTNTKNNIEIQSANIYVDTIYMNKGEDISLALPYSYGNSMSTVSYQRWFDYRTDGNYRYRESYDLLMPLMQETGYTENYEWNNNYRFANGYVSGYSIINSAPILYMTFHYPTDEEYSNYDDTYFSKEGRDNDYYVVACDVSCYTDFAENSFADYDSDNNPVESADDLDWTEPTLAGRAIFYIVGVDSDTNDAPNNLPENLQNMWRLLDTDYQGGGNTESDKYLEEYEITYPARRTSNHTRELVTLSKDARAYVVPGVEDSPASLTATISGEADGFCLVEQVWDDETNSMVPSLTGARRVLQFYNTNGDSNGIGAPWSVPDGTTATILVTKTVGTKTYNIARYKLTFKDNVTPLTQTQVAGLGTDEVNNSNYWWKDMTYRSSNYMDHNYSKVASLTFDYGSSSDAATVLNGQSGFHAFPMDWENTSYAFYDGSDEVYNESGYTWYDTDGSSRRIYTQWCMYSIVNNYFGYGDSALITDESTGQTRDGNSNRPDEKSGGTDADYWLYIDASDRPGSVAEISFDEDLCLGSEIFGTALIKSASESTSDDAGVMFTIMGVSYDTDGNEVHTPIYRQCSSQIRFTTYLNTDDSWDVGEDNLPSTVTGKGSSTNEWFQLYFSFYNTTNEIGYDHYALKIDNYCSSTTGGDYYIDEIQLYIAQPSFFVEQIEQVCTNDEETSAVRLMVDFDMLEARLGDDPTSDDDDTVDFMIINTNTYNNYLAEHPSENSDDDDANKKAIADAIEAATVQFVYEKDDEEQQANYITLKFHETYSDNTSYDTDNPGSNIPKNYDGDDYFYSYTVDGEEYLAIDFLADISPYTPYKILLLQDNGSLDEDNYATFFADCIYEDCELATDFYLTSSTILKVNGETVDPLVDYCSGQTVVIQPEVTYTADEDGNTTSLGDEYFDWFFGTEDEYTEVNETYSVSLEEALLMFRHFYPTATGLSETETPPTKDEENNIEFTQAMYNIIAYYLEQLVEGSYYSKLVLYKQYLEVVIPTSGLDLVVQPIEVVVDDDNDETPINVCFGYVPLMLNVGGGAPTFNVGFFNVEYPGDDFVPSIRLGLSQVKQASQEKNESSDTLTPIYVNLRNASYYHEEEETESNVDHLGIYTTSDGTMDGLYLVGTNDPVFEETLSDEYFSQYDLPIGKVLDLYAIEDDTQGESYMKIAFYDEYTLREGYSYIVMVNCEEKDGDDVPVEDGACQGTLPIELKIVPEYLIWTGDSTSNWNNDSHWRRANRTELNKSAEPTDDDPYITNDENGTSNGFVPMLFTKVVIPADSMACLYPAGFALDTDELYKWTEISVTPNSVTESLRDSIMYDLMVYDNMNETTGALDSMKTERYRVNLCNQLHLSSGAQMLHSELLLVDTVWTEVKIPVGKWQLVSTPLNSVYSGDWYTKTATGSETAEYFKDISFNTSDNDRYDPDVYQRSWSKAGNIIVSTNDSPTSSQDRDTPAYVSTGWTSAYNDASVEYSPGLGFSLEGWSNASTESIMFRFPKADTGYAYSSSTSELDRSKTGTLLISGLVDRSNPDNDGEDVYTGEVTVTLPENEDGNEYYLVGNPFTAPMSMLKFMEGNTDVAGYWTEGENGPIVGNWDGTSDGNDDYLLPPYTGLFITFNENSDEEKEISFTEDMQVLADNIEPLKFSIRATSSKGTTSACVTYNDTALDGYSLGEDVPLLEDDSWMRDGMPMVYTVSGDMAVSINTLLNATVIPIGAFADDDCLYTFQFTGVNSLNEPTLYDAVELTETPITEGFTLDLVGASHGRYFIRTRGTALGISEKENSVYDITAYSPTQGTIIVSSSLELENVEVYSVGGMLLNRVNAGGNISCTINGINSGVAILRAKTSEGTFVKKIRVR